MKRDNVARRYLLVILVTLVYMVPFHFGGCAFDTAEDSDTSARFGGMANVEATQTREGEEHKILISSDGYPCTITDYLGYKITLKARPERVAVLSGSFLNMWYALGGKSICRTDTRSSMIDQKFEEEINRLPSVGAVYNTNVEAIIELKPDFIIAQAGVQSNICRTLRDNGLTIATLFMRSYMDVLDHMRVFGTLLGKEMLVKDYITQMEVRKNEIVNRLPQESKSVIILYVTSSSLSVKLNNSIAGDVASILRLKNIAAGLPPDTLGSETTPLDIEYIVVQEPDVVLVTSMISSNEDARRVLKEEFTQNPAWKSIKAIQQGKVVYLPQEYFLYNAAHEYVNAIECMARGVYPETYGPLDK